jgi:glycosyltransferase involved in cell wall biosynthesis
VSRLGVGDHVIFGGFQQDTAAMMSAFDLYLATSRQETFGLSVLEAIASGLPVLYTACPALDGISTSQARHVAGTVEALGAEIRKAVEAGSLPREPDTAVFERYAMESVARQVDDLYDRIMAGRRGASRRGASLRGASRRARRRA